MSFRPILRPVLRAVRGGARDAVAMPATPQILVAPAKPPKAVKPGRSLPPRSKIFSPVLGGAGGLAYDPYFSNVVLLLPLDGADGSTTFTDYSPTPKTVNVLGAPAISTTQSQFGGASLRLTGASQALRVNQPAGQAFFKFGTGDWTIEQWVRLESLAGIQCLWDMAESSPLRLMWMGTNLRLSHTSAGGTVIDSPALGWAVGEQHHVALARKAGTVHMYVDGVLQGSWTSAATALDIADGGNFYIGCNRGDTWFMNGYVDDFRVTKGVARYFPGAFAVPTSAPAATGATSLLLALDGASGATTFPDTSPLAHTVTYINTAAITTARSKFGGAALDLPAGSNGALRIAQTGTEFQFGTGDFTIDTWICPDDPGGTSQAVFDFNEAAPFRMILAGNRVYTEGPLALSGPVLTWEAGRFYHVALVRKAGVAALYRDGELLVRAANTAALDLAAAAPVWVGCNRGDTWFFKGAIDAFRVTKGQALFDSPNITVPASAHKTAGAPGTDPLWSSVVLLLPLDGADGSTTFTDVSPAPKTVTRTGNAQISTAQSKFGGASALLDGASSALTVADSAATRMGSGDWTAEAWAYYDGPETVGLGAYDTIFTLGNGADGVSLRFADSGYGQALQVNSYNGTSSLLNTAETRAGLRNQQVHYALVCASGTISLFVQGVKKGELARTAALTDGSITAGNWPGNSFYFRGHVDDFRVTKGVARYTANFTPPTAAHPTA